MFRAPSISSEKTIGILNRIMSQADDSKQISNIPLRIPSNGSEPCLTIFVFLPSLTATPHFSSLDY